MGPQSILITGASGAIGAALAETYAAQGVTLFLCGRDEKRLASVAEACERAGAKVRTAAFDITDTVQHHTWIAQADEFKPLDLVIANAGISSGVAPDGTHESYDMTMRVIEINLKAMVDTVYPAMELMRRRGRGQIALMSSVAGLRGLPSSPAYSASKAGVKAYGEALRGLLKKSGVQVSVICPGYVQSAMSDQIKGPKPSLLSAAKAAEIIRRGLSANRACIAFPFWMAFGLRALSVLPAPIAESLLALFRFSVQPKD